MGKYGLEKAPDPNKQAQEVYFSKKSNNENSLPITFNNAKGLFRTIAGQTINFQRTYSK